MNKRLVFFFIIISIALMSCSKRLHQLTKENLELVNRELIAIDTKANTIALNNRVGDGLAIIEDVQFEEGVIELELKGENVMQKSFVGLAFNIQNDSTYEAVYFRPFNFQADEKIRRDHSIQYIYHPKHNWRYLRTNFEGQYEAEFPRRPSPDDWFGVRLDIKENTVKVFDMQSNTELLTVNRIATQSSNKIGLWTGNDSKGEFRNVRIMK